MIIRIIKTYRDVVTLCDKELLGKCFEEGEFQLDIKESFYKGDETTEEEAIILLQNMSNEDATFNIVGKKSVNTALKAGVISQEGVGKIKGIPFALILM